MKRQLLSGPAPKPLLWVASSIDDIRALPRDVQRLFGFALRMAQMGGKHPDAKPLEGFGNAGVLEVVAHDDGDAFRAIYTVRLDDRVYVLDAFQKKSRQGIATPKADMDRIRARLKRAEQHHANWLAAQQRNIRS